MSTANVTKNNESDILTVIRELEQNRGPKAIEAPKAEIVDEVEAPNPSKLLESLQNKRKLLSLLDGYGNVGGMADMKERLNDAIADLEGIIEIAD